MLRMIAHSVNSSIGTCSFNSRVSSHHIVVLLNQTQCERALRTRVEPDTRLKRVSGTDKALLPSTSIIRVIRVNICARIE